MRRRDDDAVQYTFMEMNRLLYEGHPYAMDQMGSARDVADLTLQDIEELYRDYVGPRKAVLALSGDLELKAVEGLVRSLFSDWKGGGRGAEKNGLRPDIGQRAGGRARDVPDAHDLCLRRAGPDRCRQVSRGGDDCRTLRHGRKDPQKTEGREPLRICRHLF